MHPDEYARMYEAEDRYWWFQGRKHIVVSFLKRLKSFRRKQAKVLDLGCGTGLMLDFLHREGASFGLDFSPLALRYSRQRGAYKLVQGDVQALPIRPATFDVILALDLAEHVPDDNLFMQQAREALRPGGHLVLTVPAHPFLWSEHDEALYHFRRYRHDDLKNLLEKANMTIERLTYCITLTFPLIVAFRFLQKWLKPSDRPKTHLIMLPRWANGILMGSVMLEALVLRWANLPFGVTLVAVARRS